MANRLMKSVLFFIIVLLLCGYLRNLREFFSFPQNPLIFADFFSDILLFLFCFSLRESAQSAGDSFFFSRRTR
jgi:hypothetical protein